MKNTWGRLLMPLLVFAAASALCFALYRFDNKYTSAGAQAIAGTLFVSESDWEEQPIRYLWNGWNFYPNVLLTPETYAQRAADTVIPVQIGAYNNFAFGDLSRSPHGCGTYELTLLLPSIPHTYAIELPEIFSAYRLYLGDRLILEMGNPDADGYQASVQNRMAVFEGSGTVRLLLAVRDESYVYSGMVYPPAFGEPLQVNTVRAVRICLSVAVVTLALLFAVLSLWLSTKAYRKQKNAWLFFLLCLNTALFTAYSMVHAILPMKIQPWYTVELTSGHLLTLLLLLLHNRLCRPPRFARVVGVAAASAVCLAALLLCLGADRITQPAAVAFSRLDFAFKLLTTIYLLLTALFAMRRQAWRAEPVFFADLIYGTAFFWDCLLPAYEPIVGGWFQEWGCLTLVVVLGAILWMDVAKGYRSSLTFAEEQRQMQRQLDMQQAHFRQISEKVEESRRQRHDFRQHLRAIANLAGDVEAQTAYIRQITAVNESGRPITYCRDSAVDALLYYYVSAAKKQGIAVVVRAELPEAVKLPGVAFCTILGNLLENALEACQRQTQGDRFIRLNLKWQFQKIYLSLENSYEGQLRERWGAYLSSKHNGEGVGTASARELTSRLGGSIEFCPGKDVFRVVLILPPADACP